ncbi:MAG TPA: PQQ-dependent sugar dehydrogenase [Bacteroidia bacterium]|nr:PQQ-dependent sugar dehydrogenase [Bacteroidia bacterium]
MIRILLLLLFIGAAANGNSQQFTKTQVCYGINFGIAFDVAPDGRFFVTEKGLAGPAQVKVFDATGNFLSVFYDLTDSAYTGGERGVLGITLDPDFSINHYVYVFYNYTDNPNNVSAGDDRIRIERFTDVANTGTQPTIIFDLDIPDSLSSIHTGGNIHFRPSDSTHIYVTIGDMGTGYLGDTPARIDNPLGKILRVSKYPGGPPPSDNPFYDDGDPYVGNCDWIWAYGLRNSFDFCFGPNDSLYATENGTSTFDEVNLITRGGFYGWPFCEGSGDGDTLSIPCHAPNAILPLVEVQGPVLPALTGVIFYTDTVWSVQQNHLVTGDFNHADLTDIYLTNSPAYNSADSAVFWIDESNMNGITDLWQGPDGCIYVLELSDTVFGGIYKICPVGTAITELSSSITSLSAAPNPFNDQTVITYTLASSEPVHVVLYDALGREVAILADGQQISGTHQLVIDAEKMALSPGIYSCVLQSVYEMQSVSLIVE